MLRPVRLVALLPPTSPKTMKILVVTFATLATALGFGSPIQGPDKAAAAPPRKKKAKGKAAAAAHAKPARSSYDHLSLGDLEGLVMKKEVELAALHDKFADPAVCKDPEALAELQEEVEAVSQELSAIDEAWRERADAQ